MKVKNVKFYHAHIFGVIIPHWIGIEGDYNFSLTFLIPLKVVEIVLK